MKIYLTNPYEVHPDSQDELYVEKGDRISKQAQEDRGTLNELPADG